MNSIQCPIPLSDYPQVLLAHGGGGKLMQQLIEKMFLQAFGNPYLEARLDAALLDLPHGNLAMTTDSYVVQPRFFPGGDIGSLAVHGTINDLAVSGARPLYLSVSFILEEGLPMEELWRVTLSMAEAANSAGVQIVTGDTKVVEKGKGDGLFINTTGIGIRETGLQLSPGSIRAGDGILVSGDLGRHGIAIMAQREGLEFETTLESDSAPLHQLVFSLIEADISLRCMRDLTRGGLISALWEISQAGQLSFELNEISIPISEEVRGACEILGLDPLYVANEGRMVLFIPQEQVNRALEILQKNPLGASAAHIGQVGLDPTSQVLLKSSIGGIRSLAPLTGEPLPRIC